MQVDYDSYKSRNFTCSHCGWKGPGTELCDGDFSETDFIGDLDCPNCGQLVAFWQAPLIEDVKRKEEAIRAEKKWIADTVSEAFDLKGSKLREQADYLDTIPVEEWDKLFALYDEVKRDEKGKPLDNDVVNRVIGQLIDLRIIFHFSWLFWGKGTRVLDKRASNYDDCTLLELSMILSTIFGLEAFGKKTISKCFKNGTMEWIFHALKNRIAKRDTMKDEQTTIQWGGSTPG